MDYARDRIRRILEENAHAPPGQIADMLGLDVGVVREGIASLEEERLRAASAGRRGEAWRRVRWPLRRPEERPASSPDDWRTPDRSDGLSRIRRQVRGASYLLGTGLVVLGAALLLGVGGLYAYGAYERLRFELETAETPTVAPPAHSVAIAEGAPTEAPATPTPVAAQPTQPARANPLALPPTATATPQPTSTPTPIILPARRIIVPKIKLDSRVVESPIRDGQWVVPKFVAGHLEGTADPGQGGNVVLSGHVESISSGNVFANIGTLEPGDRLSLLTEAAEFQYVVREKRVVRNDDLSVILPTSEETLTLITCTGTFLPATRDFDRRLVVIAKPAPEPVPRVPPMRSR